MRKNLFYAFLHMLGRFILWAFFRLEKSGRENIPLKGGVILASNHASFLDPILVASASPRQLYFLARESLFRGFFFPLLIKSLNAIPFPRSAPSPRTFRKVSELLKKGAAILLFPEGTRSRNGRIAEGRPGVAMLSFLTRTPVVPTLIQGSFQALPPGKKMISPVKIRVIFGEPIYPEGEATRENYRKFTHLIMERIRSLG